MPLTRFVKDRARARELLAVHATPAFLDIRSISATFLTDPAVIAELLPAPLEPASDPRVSVSVSEIRRSNCVGPFNGASVNIACRYGGEDGLYCLAMPMNADTAVIFGREVYAEPKKLADIRLTQDGAHVRGTVTRHGITYIDLLGTFADPMQEVERESISRHYYFKYFLAADGSGLAADPELVRVTHRGVAHRVARGNVTITFRESRHDPVIDLPVLSVEGGAWSESETHTRGEVVTRVPADQFLPYAFGKMDDLVEWSDRRPSASRPTSGQTPAAGR